MEALQRLHNRGSISTGYDIDNSCKFEDANDEYLTRTNASGTNDKTFTVSFWCKRSKLGGTQELWDGGVHSEGTRIGFGLSSDELWLDIGKTTKYRSSTTQKFRDTSAWYHIVWKVDTTQSTEADRFRVYVNGEEITDWASRQYPTQNFETSVYSGTLARIGSYDSTYHGFSGYMAEFNYLDGLSVAPTEFGEYDDDSGIWKPKEYTGSYPGQSAYLDFKLASDLGANAKGDDTNWTEVNLAAADQATDTPTNNFCTLNPNVKFKYGSLMTNGATTFGDDTAGGVGGAFGTMAVTKGKWYWEVKLTQQNSHYIGISAVDDGDNVTASSDPHQINSSFRFNILGARIEYINNGTNTNGSLDAFTDFHSVGDIIGIALNMDDNQISIYGNGTLQSGVANTSIYDAADKMVVPLHGTINDECQYNFGGYSAWTPSSAETDANGYGTFEYAPPSGYYALCTKNLEEYG